MKPCGHVYIQVTDVRVQRQEIRNKEALSCVISVGQHHKKSYPFRDKRHPMSFKRTREETVNIDCKYELEEIDEQIGDTDIPLEPALWNIRHSDWYTLLDRGKPTGQIYVKMQFKTYKRAEHTQHLAWGTYPPHSQATEEPFNLTYQYFQS